MSMFCYCPDYVTVGPFDFDIKHLTYKEIRSGITSGQAIQPEELVIHIPREAPEQLRLEVLLHELEHAICYCADLSDDSTEEDFVRKATTWRLKMFIDNPDLLLMLLKRSIDAGVLPQQELEEFWQDNFQND